MNSTIRNVAAFLIAAIFSLSTATILADEKDQLTGKFYVSVDDSAQIYLNGELLYKAALDLTESPEITLKPDDRILVKLKNEGREYRFGMMFASKDRKYAMSFTPSSFRLVKDPDVVDFKAEDFSNFLKIAKTVKDDSKNPFPFKNTSRWMWGEDSKSCSIATVIKKEDIKPLTK